MVTILKNLTLKLWREKRIKKILKLICNFKCVINCCLYYRILIGIVSYTNSIVEFEIFFLSSVPQFLWAQSTIKPNTHFNRQVQPENKFDLLNKKRPWKAYKRESLGPWPSLTRPSEIGPELLQKAVGNEMGWEISLSPTQKIYIYTYIYIYIYISCTWTLLKQFSIWHG